MLSTSTTMTSPEDRVDDWLRGVEYCSHFSHQFCLRRRSLISPARGLAGHVEGTRVPGSYANGSERASWRCGCAAGGVAPASDSSVGPQTASQSGTSTDGHEGTRWCGGLPLGVVAPTGDGGVRLHAARMRGASADQRERPGGWCCLAMAIATPTRNRSVRGHGARVVGTENESACADRHEGAHRDLAR
jgi:hypothetical protein